MTKKKGYMEFSMVVVWVLCGVFVLLAVVSTANKQKEDHKQFMAGCLQEKKQFECDVLWNQTAESKQNRDLAIGIAAGAAIGMAAGRK